jgi:hypothetical protein
MSVLLDRGVSDLQDEVLPLLTLGGVAPETYKYVSRDAKLAACIGNSEFSKRKRHGTVEWVNSGEDAVDISSAVHFTWPIVAEKPFVQRIELGSTPVNAQHRGHPSGDYHFGKCSEAGPGRVVLEESLPDSKEGLLFQIPQVGRWPAGAHSCGQPPLHGAHGEWVSFLERRGSHFGPPAGFGRSSSSIRNGMPCLI